MKIPLLVLFLVAGSSARFDLEHINRALTRIIDNEIQEVSECAQNVLKCTQGNIYPDCLDTEPDVVTINKADIEMDKFFVVDIFNMVLKGTMHLTKTKFHGISEFEMDQVESSVTVVPLGIEFKFRLRWKDDMDFNSRYDLKDVIYAKNVEDTPMKGKGNMNIHMKGIGYEVIAHKILGGKMDYLKITPLIEEFEVVINSRANSD